VTTDRRVAHAAPARRRAAVGRRVELGLLGGFRLQLDGKTLEVPASAQRLVAFLAVNPRSLKRVFIAGSLWMDSTEEHANANLRTALWRLQPLGCRLVDAMRNHLALAPDVVVDLHQITAEARDVLRHGTDIAADTLDDLLFVDGDLLPDWYDDWVLLERERFRQLRLYALEALCEQLTSARAFGAAAQAGMAAVAGEPLRESAHRALMKVHLAEGNTGEALRQYRFYQRLVFEQLGLQPSAEIDRLLEQLPADLLLRR
jgi:DNA-binding SARP family transcriptional activator